MTSRITFAALSSVFAALVALVSITGQAQAGFLYSDTILADNPVGYWRLAETAGSAANEGSGTGLDGTYNNFPSGVRGVNGLINANNNAAARFNGVQTTAGSSVSGSGVNTSDGGSNPFANDWTIEAWFVRDTQNTWSGIFSNNNGSVGAPVMTFIDGTHQLGINGTGVTSNNVSIDLGAGSLGDEVYAVITKTGGNADSASTLTVHANVDGTWMTPATGTNSGWWLTPGDGYYIGRHYTTGTQIHDGIIDEVAIYNRALTLSEINAHFNAGNSFVAPEPSTALAVVFGLVAFVSRRRNRRRVS